MFDFQWMMLVIYMVMEVIILVLLFGKVLKLQGQCGTFYHQDRM